MEVISERALIVSLPIYSWGFLLCREKVYYLTAVVGGLLDLIVGGCDGSVVWYRNIGSKTEPKLAEGIRLVLPAPRPSYEATGSG